MGADALTAGRHGETLSAGERDALVAVVNEGSHVAAAYALGISESALKARLRQARAKLGARSTAHAAALCYPTLAARYAIGT